MYNNSHPGIEYGDGVLKGPGTPGVVVKSVESNVFSLPTATGDKIVGVLKRTDKNCAAQAAGDTTPCVVDTGAFVFQTDQFTGSPAYGNNLTFDATTGKLKVATTGLQIVGRVLSVDGTEITVLWTNHGLVV
ncbi:MAG: hypothetical protein Q8O14_14570 [bacterium]|nr:hypothetical protein [bacterium]